MSDSGQLSGSNASALEQIERASDIVTAYVANNVIQPGALPDLIAAVHAALAELGRPPAAEPEKPQPPVPIKRTLSPDHIISLEDGRPYKMLKRHLAGYGLTPDQYRRKWGLPHDYPMTAANYAAQRSELARNNGLGRSRTERAAAGEEARGAAPGGRGRPRAT
ncbi:hypothetical protein OPKNFCMD_5547 [Methylobacterium crusticola]|uniref:MucR family transcriptional regulator n=1 Tax=Methylobacterium crusticola TaxID=1697972 RepID=A0ABQ4R787_9HYPH|nr:MucR family transcriptional regulator [Methylobacterium crusticola]GJD52780.1 hypothetical protein OPKNFCMD_5547 [Methylobacterium crusticola]